MTKTEIENQIRQLLVKYNAEYALLFGSYARGEETENSDVDVVVFGGDGFKNIIFLPLPKICDNSRARMSTHLKFAR